VLREPTLTTTDDDYPSLIREIVQPWEAKNGSSPRRRPQPISSARMAWFRFPHSVAVSDRSSKSRAWAGVSQLPARTPRRRTPLTRRIPPPQFRAQQSRVARLVSHAAYRRQTQIDGVRSVPFLFQVDPVSQDHGAIECQTWLGAIQATKSLMAWSYVRCPLTDVRVLRTTDLACSRSGSASTRFGVLFFRDFDMGGGLL
jgi:hypothetical protein